MQTGKELFKKIIIDGEEVDIDTIDANNGVYGNIPLSKTKIKVQYVYNDNVTSIPAGVFSGISSLKKVRFPSNIVSIADDAFTGSGIDSDSISTIKAINTRSFRYPITLSVSQQSITVQENGSVSLPTVTASSNNSTVTGLTYTYQSSDTSKVTISNGVLNGVASGTATITVTFAGNDNYSGATMQYQVTVSAAQKSQLPNLSVTLSGWKYGSTANSPVITGNLENGTVSYQYKTASTSYSNFPPSTNLAPGDYTLKATVAETTTYAQTEATTTFTVSKADGSITISGKSLSYTGSTQALIVVSNATGTPYFRVKKDGQWITSWASNTIPTASAAGSYIIYYYVTATDYYEAVANEFSPNSVSSSISSSSITYTAPTKNENLIYNEQNQNLVTAGSVSSTYGTMKYSTDGTNWSTSVPQRKDACSDITVYWKIEANDGYEDVDSTSITGCGIAKVTPTVTAPKAAANLKYNSSAKTLIDENNAGSTNYGTLKYSTDGTNYSTNLPTASTVGTHTVYYRVDGDSNINNVTAQTISVTIAKGDGSVTTTPTPKEDLTYTGKAQAFFDDNTKGSGTGNMAYKVGENGSWSGSIPTATKAGDYTVYYKAIANDNYNESAVSSLTCSIAKAAPTITKYPAAASDLTYTEEALDLITLGESDDGSFYYTIDNEHWFIDESPTATEVGKYTVYWVFSADDPENYTDITDTESITVEITAGEEEEPTVDVSATSEAITETSEGTDDTHVKFIFVNNTGETLQQFIILTDDGTGNFVQNEINESCSNGSSVEKSYSSAMTPFDPSIWGENQGNIVAYANTDHSAGNAYVGLCTESSYALGYCYTITFKTAGYSSNNTVSGPVENEGSIQVPSTKKIGIKIKNNTDESITINKVQFKTDNSGTVTSSNLLNISTSAVTISSNKTSDTYEIDISESDCKGQEFASGINNIILYDSNDNALISAEASGSLTVGTLYTITYGQKANSEEIVDNEDDVSNYYWAANNYIMDVAIDSYLTHNWNMGQQTMKKNAERPCIGWEDYDKGKRERLVRVAVVPEFNDRFIYGGPYYVQNIITNGQAETEQFTGEKGTLTYDRYKFTEIQENQHSADNKETYIIKGPFTDLGLGLNSNAVKYFNSIRNIADTAGRDPAFGLNYGRVRPLGGLQNHSERRPKEVGNIWNSISSTKLIDIASLSGADDGNTSDINSDGPTSYPSGHSAQAWIIALGIAQIYGSNSPNVVKYAAEAYKLGVDRTIGRFHWNSDTMYGRLWSTMIFPIVNAIKELNGDPNNLYEASCTQLNNEGHSSALPTDSNYTDSYFTTLVDEFNSITGVSISDSIEKYLWSMYQAAETVRTSNHDFLKATTYPEVFPEEGYDVNIDGTTSTMKYRGDNTKYYYGNTELDSISQKSIMQSWLMAMCLAEIFYSNDTNEDISIANASLYNNDQNIQTQIFAKAYELGGGRKLDLYHEYQIDYDPTILRLAASLVYATERGKYSFGTIRSLNNTQGISIGNLDLTDRSVAEQSLGCIADRSSKKYSVGYGINTYYIFNDGAGPHSTTDGIYSSYIKNPFETKSVGTDVLNTQCQDQSLFIITPSDGQTRINLTVRNDTGEALQSTGEAFLYVDTSQLPDEDYRRQWSHIGVKIVFDDSLANNGAGPGSVHHQEYDLGTGDEKEKEFSNALCIDGCPDALGLPFEADNENYLVTKFYVIKNIGGTDTRVGLYGGQLSGTLQNGGSYTFVLTGRD